MKYSEWNSVVEYVSNNLAKEIEDNNYPVGARFLTEKEICEKYQVGRSSAREALRILEATGWVEISRGKGAFVMRNSDKTTYAREWYAKHTNQTKGLIEARILLETSIAVKIVSVITDKQLARLTQVYEDLDKAYNSNNILNIVALDEQFHITLVDFYGNSYLSNFNQSLQAEGSRYRAKTYHVLKFIKLAQVGHYNILEGLRRRDAESVVRSLRDHILGAESSFAELSTDA